MLLDRILHAKKGNEMKKDALDAKKEGKIAGPEILNASKMLGVSKNFLAYSFKGLASIEVKEKKSKYDQNRHQK